MVIVSSQYNVDAIDAADLVGKGYVVGHSHVRQGHYGVEGSVFRLEFRDATFDKVNGRFENYILRVQGWHNLEPFPLHETDNQQSRPSFLRLIQNVILVTSAQRLVQFGIPCIAAKPWEVALILELAKLLEAKVKVVISQTGNINPNSIQNGNHLFAAKDGRHERWAEGIAAEEGDDLSLLLLSGSREEFLSCFFDRCDEWRRLFDVVDVVEVDEGSVGYGHGEREQEAFIM
mmetsp:Transcript_28325/g.59830  ORF Transcript_28325/g.59830 Transcript_28325/m.59830 type:complete len:232 (+) Transcript_28325:1285-1980(+)